MAVQVQNDYRLETEPLTPDQIRAALTGDLEGFRYFFENCCQIQDKVTRELVHPKMNKGQEMIAETILRHVAKETRANFHKEVVLCGPRQFGKSTILMAIANYMAAYVPGMERLNIIHSLQTGGAASKFYSQKVAPLVAGVHPDIFANIQKDTLGTSTQLLYKDVKGIPRDSIYEILSASSNSVRSGTVTVWLADEPSEYRNPEMTEDAISGAIGDYGFSFTAYIGTFSDRISDYFLTKIQKAIEAPDEMELIFIPWFLVYGRPEDAGGFSTDQYTEYDRTVSIPEMRKYGYKDDEILYKLAWYHRRALRTSKMRYEFPSSVQDLISLASDAQVFDKEALDKQEKNIEPGAAYRLITDNQTKKVEAKKTEESPFRIYRAPVAHHRYKVIIDPITAQNDFTDIFAMSVFDEANNEQVAVFTGRGMPMEDYADYAVGIAKIYNRAMLVPEINVAEGFIAYVNEGHRYYNWYYPDSSSRKKRAPGLRTTATSKEQMIGTLDLLLKNGNIIIHDNTTLDQLRNFVKKIKKREDGGVTVRMSARGHQHDDLVATLWLYAGTLDQQSIVGKKTTDWTVWG